MARLALIVGVNRYQMPGADLRGCVPDAQRYRKLLVEAAGYSSEHVVVLTDKAAKTKPIKQAAGELTRGMTDADSFHFIMSSHGCQTVAGDARTDCLCPYDFDWSPDRLISADWLHELVAGIPAGARVRVVIDACHSGDVLRNGMPRPDETALVVGARSMPGSPAFERHHGKHLRFRDLTKVFPSAGFLAACRSSETAADAAFRVGAKFVYQGALSWYLCAELEKPGGLTRSIRRISVAAYAALRAAGYEQHPVLRGPWEEISKGFTTEVPSGT